MSLIYRVRKIFMIGKSPSDLVIHSRYFNAHKKGSQIYINSIKSNPYWFDNDPIKTHFFNALQSVFPEGERFFIDSVRDGIEAVRTGNIRSKVMITDEEYNELSDNVKMFIFQEAQHGRQHDIINDSLVFLGYDRIDFYTEMQRNNRIRIQNKYSISLRLSITAAAEHFTAVFSSFALCGTPKLFDVADAPFRELFVFHCAEEIEHKSVCFDLYRSQNGGYFLRIYGLFLAVLDEAINVRYKHRYLLKKDGKWTLKNRLKAWSFIWGPKGVALSLLPPLLKYLNPWFHPWDTDERSDIKDVLEKYVED